jgi:hypothetical protein
MREEGNTSTLTADELSIMCGNNTVFFPFYTTHLILNLFVDLRKKTLKYIQSRSNGIL